MKEINLEKLPKHVQEYIKDLKRQRETAVRALNEYVDHQTPASFYMDENECTGEEQGPSLKRRYFQGYRMMIQHAGVEVSIILRDGQIDMQWSGDHGLGTPVVMTPSSYQAIRLIAVENLK